MAPGYVSLYYHPQQAIRSPRLKKTRPADDAVCDFDQKTADVLVLYKCAPASVTEGALHNSDTGPRRAKNSIAD